MGHDSPKKNFLMKRIIGFSKISQFWLLFGVLFLSFWVLFGVLLL